MRTIILRSFVASSLFISVSATAQNITATPNLGIVPESCMAYMKNEGWGVLCPGGVNEESAYNARNRALPILPGHNSRTDAYTSSSLGYPTTCVVAIDLLSKRAEQFTSWLRNVRFGGKFYGILTGDAAYEVGQLIHSYTIQVEREGKRKYNYSRRGENGDELCTQHVNFGVSEIIRITQIVLDEANKGNRDLAGTGLNSRASPYNR